MGIVDHCIHKVCNEKYRHGYAVPLSGIQLQTTWHKRDITKTCKTVPHYDTGQSPCATDRVQFYRPVILGATTHHSFVADQITRRLNFNISNLISYKSKKIISPWLRLGGLQRQFHKQVPTVCYETWQHGWLHKQSGSSYSISRLTCN
jgi:hypothetical protein